MRSRPPASLVISRPNGYVGPTREGRLGFFPRNRNRNRIDWRLRNASSRFSDRVSHAGTLRKQHPECALSAPGVSPTARPKWRWCSPRQPRTAAAIRVVPSGSEQSAEDLPALRLGSKDKCTRREWSQIPVLWWHPLCLPNRGPAIWTLATTGKMTNILWSICTYTLTALPSVLPHTSYCSMQFLLYGAAIYNACLSNLFGSVVYLLDLSKAAKTWGRHPSFSTLPLPLPPLSLYIKRSAKHPASH